VSTEDDRTPTPLPGKLLRVTLVVAACLLFAQSVTAGLFLAGVEIAFPIHRETATVAGVAYLVALTVAIWHARRGASKRPIWATLGMLVLMSAQAFAGFRELTPLHIPLGVITIAAGIALAVGPARFPEAARIPAPRGPRFDSGS